jgi:hypothetical protein
MTGHVANTFTAIGHISEAMPSFGTIKVYTTGVGASNVLVLEKSTDNGETWSTAATYNSSDQNGATVTSSEINAQHRLRCSALVAGQQLVGKLER